MNESQDIRTRDEFLISRYLDETVDGAERRGLESRLSGDESLALLLAQHRAVEDMVRIWGRAVPDVDWAAFEAGFRRKRVRADRLARRPRRLWPLFAPLAAAAAAVVAFTFTFQNDAPPDAGRAVAIARPEAMVEILRPPGSPAGNTEAYVSYSHQPRGNFVRVGAPRRGSRGVIAMAAVGKHVNWPANVGLR